VNILWFIMIYNIAIFIEYIACICIQYYIELYNFKSLVNDNKRIEKYNFKICDYFMINLQIIMHNFQKQKWKYYIEIYENSEIRI